ncbi:Hypothetical_protein [Hexamita inflata]|uniref:Hypothetical_protein n=1 Tax=Hexamita inflata TaxID=28002 RepID=A0AA86VCH8_9EUKA|nr:Hypothetical protein HINF_LOCUS50448 [Hexamita inflata]
MCLKNEVKQQFQIGPIKIFVTRSVPNIYTFPPPSLLKVLPCICLQPHERGRETLDQIGHDEDNDSNSRQRKLAKTYLFKTRLREQVWHIRRNNTSHSVHSSKLQETTSQRSFLFPNQHQIRQRKGRPNPCLNCGGKNSPYHKTNCKKAQEYNIGVYDKIVDIEQILRQYKAEAKIIPIIVGKNCTLHKESHLYLKELKVNMQTFFAEIGYKISRQDAQMCNNSLYKKRNLQKETNLEEAPIDKLEIRTSGRRQRQQRKRTYRKILIPTKQMKQLSRLTK